MMEARGEGGGEKGERHENSDCGIWIVALPGDFAGVAFMSNVKCRRMRESRQSCYCLAALIRPPLRRLRGTMGIELYALSVDYGQRHRFELDAARRVAESLGVRRHVVASVGLNQFGGSALTDAIDVPLDRGDEEMSQGIPVTYVPARNTVFLSLALGYAEVVARSTCFLA